jgi:3-methylfumaryl-CoA hydratase
VSIPYSSWIGREEIVTSGLDPWPAQALRATLGLERATTGAGQAPPETLPPLWSWLYFLEAASRDQIGLDGHAARGGFMPPINAPRRMFAGGALTFVRSLRLGVPAQQTRRVLKIEEKSGAAGPHVFVTIGLDHIQAGDVCVRETRDIVYLHPGVAADDAPATSVASATWSLDIEPDPVLLMRFSALTFNGHRIHYDLPYAQQLENYPERVVHGPLIAMLLAELVRLEGGAELAAFSFRARAPLFLGQSLNLRGEPDSVGGVALTAYSGGGRVIMTAKAQIA